MNESHITGWIAGLLQFAVAGYALRLNRRFGTARVGWSIFGAFALLALIQLMQSTSFFSGGSDSNVEVNVAYVLISFLLLIGMLHMETMLKGRLQAERIEQQLRADLESEVKSKTAHLNRAIEELMSEIDETKRMTAIIDSTEGPGVNKTADGFAEAALKPAPMCSLSARDGESEYFLAGVLGGEWLAHF
jgi:hypothetical protein